MIGPGHESSMQLAFGEVTNGTEKKCSERRVMFRLEADTESFPVESEQVTKIEVW